MAESPTKEPEVARQPFLATPENLRKRPIEVLFDERLNEIWVNTERHRAVRPELRGMFLTAARRAVVDPGRLVGSVLLRRARAQGVDRIPGEPITGKPGEIEFAVSREVAGLSPGQTEVYIRRRLAGTLAAMEASDHGSREARVDIIDKALTTLMGQRNAADLAIDGFRYLWGAPSEERRVGFFASVARAALYFEKLGFNAQIDAILMFHESLAGVCALTELDDGLNLRLSREVASVSANNTAGHVAQIFQDEGREFAGDSSKALQALLSISAVMAPPLPTDPELAAAVTSVLGLGTDNAVDTLTTLARMATAADAWSTDNFQVARLEAGSAIAKGTVADAGDDVPGTLYNAGISAGRDPRGIGGSLKLYALGLRWALELSGGDVVAALTDLGAVQNAGNFMGALVRLSQSEAAESRAEHRLARSLAHLPVWAPLASARDERVQRTLQQLAAASRLLGIGGDADRSGFEPSELRSALDEYLASVVSSWQAAMDSGAHIAQRAALVAQSVFSEVLDDPDAGVWGHVRELAASRSAPLPALRTLYEPYMDRPGGAGALALDAAGLTSPDVWRARLAQLTEPLDQISPSLFRLQRLAGAQAEGFDDEGVGTPVASPPPDQGASPPDETPSSLPGEVGSLVDQLITMARENERLKAENEQLTAVLQQLARQAGDEFN